MLVLGPFYHREVLLENVGSLLCKNRFGMCEKGEVRLGLEGREEGGLDTKVRDL